MVLCTIKLLARGMGLNAQIGFAFMRTYSNVPTRSYCNNSFPNCSLNDVRRLEVRDSKIKSTFINILGKAICISARNGKRVFPQRISERSFEINIIIK